MLDHPTICIVGAGALGGYYGARLAQHGNNVHFLLRGDYDAVRKNGWSIKSYQGDFSLAPGSLGVWNDAAKMPKADLVLVTLKTTTNDQFEPLITPLIKDDTAILTLQNGLGNEERLAALFGKEHVLGGIAFTCINRVAPGEIDHSAAGWIRLGEFGGGAEPTGDADFRIAVVSQYRMHGGGRSPPRKMGQALLEHSVQRAGRRARLDDRSPDRNRGRRCPGHGQ